MDEYSKNIIHEFAMDAVSLMNMDKISSMKKLNFHGRRVVSHIELTTWEC
jgi:hypothetical protein